jgi:antirestriction protein
MEEEPHEIEGSRNDEPVAETRPEQDPKPDPRIYVASLSDYNAGRLHGEWLSAGVEQDELEAGVQTMLAASPTPGAEEFGIFDYEGFGPLRLDEYESLSKVAMIGRGIAEHGSAYAHWAALVGTTDIGESGEFEDAYRGHWESVTAYADDLLDDLGANRMIEQAIPEFLQPYVKVDVEGFARDLELGGDITTSEGDGGVYVFDGGPWS